MTSERRSIPDLDDLLRTALADDLPADVAAGMSERIERVRTENPAAGTRAPSWAWLARRSVWAVLSILMLVTGLLLQGLNASSPLAKRIASLKTTYGTVEPTRR
jgi:hypothetical protein